MKNKTVESATALLGKTIKKLQLPSSSGEVFDLSSECKNQRVVLYFYPKDNTPGCTTESLEFEKLLKAFKKENCAIFGISRDSLKSHDKFICKYDFKFPLLADEDEIACKMFDVIKEKNMYGKKVMGIERSTFVFDVGGKVVGEFRKVKAEGHAQAILEFVKSL